MEIKKNIKNADKNSSATPKNTFVKNTVYIFTGVIVLAIIAIIVEQVSNNKLSTRNVHVTPASQSALYSPIRNTPPEFVSSMLKNLLKELEKNPDNAELTARIGDVYFEMNKFPEAIGYYKKAVTLNPGDVDNLNDLGLSLFYVGNPVEAMGYLDQGISINPNFQRIWLSKGFVAANGLKDAVQAKSAFEKVLQINPDNLIAESAKEYLTKIGN